jgi:hypothetical protein
MIRQHARLTAFARRLRCSAERLASAGAWQDPNPLLQLRAEERRRER